MAKTKAVRLTDQEDAIISEFLQMNPFFDFSSLARTAILTFVKNPKLPLKALKKHKWIVEELRGRDV